MLYIATWLWHEATECWPCFYLGRIKAVFKTARFGISTHNPRPYFSFLPPYSLIMFLTIFHTWNSPFKIEIDFLLPVSHKALHKSPKSKILLPLIPLISGEARTSHLVSGPNCYMEWFLLGLKFHRFCRNFAENKGVSSTAPHSLNFRPGLGRSVSYYFLPLCHKNRV